MTDRSASERSAFEDTRLEAGLPVATSDTATGGARPPEVIDAPTEPEPGDVDHEGPGHQPGGIDEHIHEPQEPGPLEGLVHTVRGWLGRYR